MNQQLVLVPEARRRAGQHSSASNEHYTPSSIVEPAREVLGSIDLDPASCALANTIVRAARFFTEEDNGLARVWSGNVFNNPPGGTDETGSVQRRWWYRLAQAHHSGEIRAAVYVGFSVEILQRAQVKATPGLPRPTDYPFVIPAQRIQYLREEVVVDTLFGTETRRLVPGTSPPHSSVIVFLPPRDFAERREALAKFAALFGAMGALCGPLSTGGSSAGGV